MLIIADFDEKTSEIKIKIKKGKKSKGKSEDEVPSKEEGGE